MKKFENNRSIQENKKLLEKYLNSHISEIKSDTIKKQQKILELCHLGKFLIFYEDSLKIEQVTEKPDFILKNEDEKIGLEHLIVIDPKEKKREGFFQDIFDKAEQNLKREKDLPNFLANCYIRPYVNFPTNEKSKLITIVETVVHEYIINGYLIENPIIDKIWKMPHSQISINPNLGAWWEKDITVEKIQKAISKKEKLIETYKKKGTDRQWLLMVIGSTGASSFNMNENLNFDIESEFEQIFILEDFYNNLYKIK